MPTFIMLTRLSPEGVQTIKNNPGRIKEVNQRDRVAGGQVKAQWATLGEYDFVNIVEAPDEKTMARVSLELGSRGTARYKSMAAIPIDDFIGPLCECEGPRRRRRWPRACARARAAAQPAGARAPGRAGQRGDRA